jgi:hypothetical protein
MASFTLRAGAFGGAAGSSSVARVRGGAFVVDLVRVRSRATEMVAEMKSLRALHLKIECESERKEISELEGWKA